MKSAKAKPASIAKKRILIVDDHPMMREGLSQLIAGDASLELCGEAANAAAALDAVTRLSPDLLLADISLPDKNGLELIKDVLAVQPGLKILVISMHDEAFYAERVLRAGARGYIMKHEGGQRIGAAIRQVLEDRVYVSEAISAKILNHFSGRKADAGKNLVEGLSDREFEVFQLIGEGKSTRDIAEQLHLSVKTVEVHRLNIKNKLGLKTSAELIRAAVRWVETQGAPE